MQVLRWQCGRTVLEGVFGTVEVVWLRRSRRIGMAHCCGAG